MKGNMYTILVVEDDEIDVMNIDRAFKKVNMGNPVYFAKDGLEAKEQLQAGQLHKPLLILLDINMPRMNGLEFMEWLRTDPEWCHVPVVVLTTSSAEKDKWMAYSLHAVGYVIKPLDMNDFMEAVATVGSYWALQEFPPSEP